MVQWHIFILDVTVQRGVMKIMILLNIVQLAKLAKDLKNYFAGGGLHTQSRAKIN